MLCDSRQRQQRPAEHHVSAVSEECYGACPKIISRMRSEALHVQAMIPAEIQDHERIRAQTNAALNAMNSAVDGRPLPSQYNAHPAAATGPSIPAPTGLAASRWASGNLAPTQRIASCQLPSCVQLDVRHWHAALMLCSWCTAPIWQATAFESFDSKNSDAVGIVRKVHMREARMHQVCCRACGQAVCLTCRAQSWHSAYSSRANTEAAGRALC